MTPARRQEAVLDNAEDKLPVILGHGQLVFHELLQLLAVRVARWLPPRLRLASLFILSMFVPVWPFSIDLVMWLVVGLLLLFVVVKA